MKHIVVRIVAGLVLVGAIAGIALFAYNAGGSAAMSAPTASGEAGAQPYMFHGYGMPFWRPFGFFGFGLLGLLVPLFLLFLAFGAFRRLMWGPRWGWGHHGHGPRPWGMHGEGLPPMFAEWHKRAHEAPETDKQE
jgi:hypothetical protein